MANRLAVSRCCCGVEVPFVANDSITFTWRASPGYTATSNSFRIGHTSPFGTTAYGTAEAAIAFYEPVTFAALAGKTITSAYIETMAAEWIMSGYPGLDTWRGRLEGARGDQAFLALNNTTEAEAVPRTTAHVDWTRANSDPSPVNYYQSPDLTAIVQEIIDHASWDASNGISFFCVDNGSDAVSLTSAWDNFMEWTPSTILGPDYNVLYLTYV